MYLTATHQSPPSHITADGKRWPVATLIARDDREKLASLGVYWHRPDTEPGPHGPWEFVDGEYRREPIGTLDEIQAALDAQASAEREAYLDNLECTRLQGKLALIKFGLWDAYETMIADARATMSPAEMVFVDDAQTWRYRDPVLQAFAKALQLTEDQVVELFETARGL